MVIHNCGRACHFVMRTFRFFRGSINWNAKKNGDGPSHVLIKHDDTTPDPFDSPKKHAKVTTTNKKSYICEPIHSV